MRGPAQLCFHQPHKHPFICGVMEERLRQRNNVKGSYALAVKYGVEERVAWMPDLVDCVSFWVGGRHAAWLLRRIRCSHSGVTPELVTGDVMGSDYRQFHKLSAKRTVHNPAVIKGRLC